jgi:hypothetical protein
VPIHDLIISFVGGSDWADVDVEIKCLGITDECAEWINCEVPECPGSTGGDDTLHDVSDVAHGQQHKYLDESWMVRSGSCYLANHGHDMAGQVAEKLGLGDGRYEVTPEFDDGTLTDLVLVDCRPKPSDDELFGDLLPDLDPPDLPVPSRSSRKVRVRVRRDQRTPGTAPNSSAVDRG